MKARHYIYVYYQVGNVGSQDVKVIEHQPENGFDSEQAAEQHLSKLIEARKGIYFDRDWYKFTILKTYCSKSALDNYKLEDKIIEIAEKYHDREVMASVSMDNQDCGCCNNATLITCCIEHDSQNYSKDLNVCPDCYEKIATYWKEHNPKK